MKLVLIVVMCCLSLVQVIESKKCRVIMTDKILDYDLDKTVAHSSTYFNRDNSWIEEIDDENVRVGGYVLCTKSMDPNKKLKAMVRTQYRQQSSWIEGPVQMIKEDLCSDFRLPGSLWYNVTSPWSPDFCPPQEGDKWIISNQTLTALLNIPPSTPIAPWRAYILLSQGMPGFETVRMGFGIQVELVDV